MRFVTIAGKLANIENIKYINHRVDNETGRVYCLYVFDKQTVLEEVFEDITAFEQALIRNGITPEKTEEMHHIKKMCIMGIEKIKKIIGR